ncbi:hypothetical protein ALC53_10325 [Atta colombica]|uniref:C2H2-type domain-containing protein n=1 Tax=Atta colombica TaxID=520822 RepID=A0A195B3U8_9HYME|nr:hypothetical protein ALC53_10325 [Atta colombica]
MENGEMESYDYLRECISNLENKNSEVGLAANSTGVTDISLQGDGLDDVNLNSIDFNFMKIESLFLQNTLDSTNCIKNEEEKTKQNSSIDVDISHSIQHFNTMSLNFSNFSNSKDSDNITIVHNNDSYTFNKDQCLENKNTENYNCSVKLYTENIDTDSNVTNINQSIISELKREVKVNNLELLDGDEQFQKCEQCLMTFRYKRHLDRHLEGHQKNNCPHCNEKFARRKHLDVHLFRAHGEKVVRHPHLCDVCPKSFPKRALLNRHRAKHTYQNGKVCSDCGDMINMDIDEKEHKEIHCPHFCADCRHSFVKKDDYFRHLESALHLNKVNKDIPVRAIFSCAICSKKLITQRALDQHVRRIHKGAKRFVCNIYGCTFQCARRTDLDRHKHLHVEERNIVCEHCGKTFTSVSILKDHVLYIHSKERQFICEECGKAFKRNSLLKRHKLSHEQHRPFACMQCNTAFKRSHHLTRHMETCHRITLEKKKKVVKLMKTKDGHLVPVPDKPNRSETDKIKAEKGCESIAKNKEKDYSVINVKKEAANVNSQLEIQPSLNPEENSECRNLSLESTNLSIVESIPQVFSLVDVNTGQVLTVEITNNSELLPTNELVNQLGTNCNEILNLPDYPDTEFQNSLLNIDQMCYDNTNYSEISLENIEGSFPLVSNNSKMEMIESYLTHEFPAFLNI